jgi:hypothetical protein
MGLLGEKNTSFISASSQCFSCIVTRSCGDAQIEDERAYDVITPLASPAPQPSGHHQQYQSHQTSPPYSTMTKCCTICSKPRDILVRCQIDETQKWHFVCPGACWKSVSGGIEDAKGMQDQYPHYRYGGMVSLQHGKSSRK